jgi:hypothetical protein
MNALAYRSNFILKKLMSGLLTDLIGEDKKSHHSLI